MDIPFTNLSAQQLLEMYVAYQLLSAAVQSLDPPTAESNGLYRFIFKFLSLLIADFNAFAGKNVKPKNPTQDNPQQ